MSRALTICFVIAICGVLRAAGIPCHITLNEIEEPPKAASRVRSEYCLMVPGALNLNATSVLDRDLFNAEQEADWRSHLEALSDEELTHSPGAQEETSVADAALHGMGDQVTGLRP